jgi:hypothetical protein
MTFLMFSPISNCTFKIFAFCLGNTMSWVFWYRLTFKCILLWVISENSIQIVVAWTLYKGKTCTTVLNYIFLYTESISQISRFYAPNNSRAVQRHSNFPELSSKSCGKNTHLFTNLFQQFSLSTTKFSRHISQLYP